ncbi:hypothetical protein DYBT9275_03017 [Dyadobacter sp. CECT 9275]|uniref:Uncharacterized protein n=1 Tax=Dyadobacter helix TaxID=2822344 RepID=A0A916JDP7_9BACT|nr:hypothetical protein DYBT9275_03017 [Dyadobacter sp. CECT 9275]
MPKFFITLSKVNSRLDFPDGYFFELSVSKIYPLLTEKAGQHSYRLFPYNQSSG